MKVKERDVYQFRYNDGKERFMPYHCFDGTLIAEKTNNGLLLVDQYWSSGYGGRRFTVEEAFKQGEMTFLCNLDEVDEISQGDTKYYNNEDVIHLRIHAGYKDRYFVKKGTQRSPQAMISYCNRKIESAKGDIEYATSEITRYEEKISKIESGSTEVII